MREFILFFSEREIWNESIYNFKVINGLIKQWHIRCVSFSNTGFKKQKLLWYYFTQSIINTERKVTGVDALNKYCGSRALSHSEEKVEKGLILGGIWNTPSTMINPKINWGRPAMHSSFGSRKSLRYNFMSYFENPGSVLSGLRLCFDKLSWEEEVPQSTACFIPWESNALVLRLLWSPCWRRGPSSDWAWGWVQGPPNRWTWSQSVRLRDSACTSLGGDWAASQGRRGSRQNQSSHFSTMSQSPTCSLQSPVLRTSLPRGIESRLRTF